MEIKELRQTLGMSQRQFAAHYGIPLGTLRNWEQGISNPPNYVFTMILLSSRRDQMINVETIKFVQMLEKLAELSKNGIASFAKATSENWGTMAFYDTSKPDEDGNFPVVLDAWISDDHHDIVSYYDSHSHEYTVRVNVDEGEEPSIDVKLLMSDEFVCIYHGKWHFA